MLRVCERNHWTYAQWDALSEDEKIDRLAFQRRRDEFYKGLMNSLHERIEDEKPVELTALMSVMMGMYAA